MAREIVEPTITYEEEYPGGPTNTVESHPAFGSVSISRAGGGGGVLFGSDFSQQYYMMIRVRRSRRKRRLSRDWDHAALSKRDEVVEFAMTESQWATFVSSVGMGEGVPCTLTWTERDGMVPGLPDLKNRREQFSGEVSDDLREMIDLAAELERDIEASNLSTKAKKAMANKLDAIRKRVDDSIPFVAKQFAEFMEDQVEAAKQQVNGYTRALAERTGIAALREGFTPIEPPGEPPRQIETRVRERTRPTKEAP